MWFSARARQARDPRRQPGHPLGAEGRALLPPHVQRGAAGITFATVQERELTRQRSADLRDDEEYQAAGEVTEALERLGWTVAPELLSVCGGVCTIRPLP